MCVCVCVIHSFLACLKKRLVLYDLSHLLPLLRLLVSISTYQTLYNIYIISLSLVENAPTNGQKSGGLSSTIQRQKQAFAAKLQTFKLQLARLGFAQSSRLKFNIRRDHLLEDAYEHTMKSEIRQLQRKRLNIAFRGEEG